MASITFRLTDDEKVVLQNHAHSLQIPLSELVRLKVMANIETAPDPVPAKRGGGSKERGRDGDHAAGVDLPVAPSPNPPRYACPRRCGWTAPSPKAFCPNHPGKTHPV